MKLTPLGKKVVLFVVVFVFFVLGFHIGLFYEKRKVKKMEATSRPSAVSKN